MPQPTIRVRGNLGGNPDYLPAKQQADGTALPAKIGMNVYEDRSRRNADGEWEPDPRGPVIVRVQLFGRLAETVRRMDLRQGDPVVATGVIAESDAWIDRNGEAASRLVLTANTLCLDSLLLQARHDSHQAADRTSTPEQEAASDRDATEESDTDGR